MRLLNTSTLELEEFSPSWIPPYAILSHTWEDDEFLFNDVIDKTGKDKAGYVKVIAAADQAIQDDLEYIWVDTCCINKESSAELSEAINSMFTWYQNAQVCYAYLSDVQVSADEKIEVIPACRWFTRGWTLQELLAPKDVVFYSGDWLRLGTKADHCESLSRLTGIDKSYLCHRKTLDKSSIAQRMSWASERETTRPEDIAYCLMGIFSVNMPLLYGEGNRAFFRLQEEIMRHSDDQSIFAWYDPTCEPSLMYGLLAGLPAAFKFSGSIVSYENWESRQSFAMTNRGLRIELPLKIDKSGKDQYIASLNCPYLDDDYSDDAFLGIYLWKFPGIHQYARIKCDQICKVQSDRGKQQTVYVRDYALPPSLDQHTGGLFPHHIIVLETMAGSPEYTLVETLPPRKANDGPLNPGLVSGLVEMEPAALRDARNTARKWVPSHCRFVFSVPKRINQLAAALLFRHDPTDSHVCVMFAMADDFGLGFHATDISASRSSEPEASSSTKPEWPRNLSDLQHLFTPLESESEMFPGTVILHRTTVKARTPHVVSSGGKYHLVEIILHDIEP